MLLAKALKCPGSGSCRQRGHCVLSSASAIAASSNRALWPIEEIATVEIRGKARRNYSYATKCCAFHRPDLYPIYDSLVVQVLNTLLNALSVRDIDKYLWLLAKEAMSGTSAS